MPLTPAQDADLPAAAAFELTDADRHALLDATTCLRSGDAAGYAAALGALARCPLDPQTGAPLTAPYQLCVWWLAVGLSRALDHCEPGVWGRPSRRAAIANLIGSKYGQRSGAGPAVAELVLALAAGADGQLAAGGSATAKQMTAAGCAALAWLADEHSLDISAAILD